jgi:hypothetical protein
MFLASELSSQEEPKGTFTAVDVVVSFILNTVGVVSQLTLSGIAFIRHRQSVLITFGAFKSRGFVANIMFLTEFNWSKAFQRVS